MHYLIPKYKEARNDILQTLKMLAGKEEAPVSEELSAREVVCLIIAWDTHLSEVIEDLFEGETSEEIDDVAAFDSKAILEYQDMDWQQLTDLFEETSEHILMSLEFLEEEQWQEEPYIGVEKTLEQCIMDRISHYKTHFSELSKLI